VGTLHENKFKSMIMSRSALKTRNISDEICSENHNTRFLFILPLPKMVPFMR